MCNTQNAWIKQKADAGGSLSSVAFSKLISSINQEFARIIGLRKETCFLKSLEDLAFLQAPWSDFIDIYKKVQFFAKTQALPIFTDIYELAAFELNFNNKWIRSQH